jgi:hypothetical protein
LVSICARSGRSGLFGVLQRFGAAGDLEPMLDFVYATASRAEALKNAE